MKAIFVSLLFVLGLGGAAVASEISEASSYYYNPYYGSSFAQCQAYTICPNGMPIRCWAYGNGYAGAACTWSVVPGNYVECTGFNDWGQWAVNWARCY